MKELSLNILDIAENSAKAGATRVEIELLQRDGKLVIRIADNGCGMDAEFLKSVTDPFTTTRTTRRVGMGIPLFKEAAQMTGGDLSIESEVGAGTEVRATFYTRHIDCAPVGDMADTIVTLVRCHPQIDFYYRRAVDGREFALDTAEVREIMQGIPIESYEVCSFIKDYINENTDELSGGKEL